MKKKLIYLAVIMLCGGLFLLYVVNYRGNLDTQPPTISFSEGVLELSALDPKEALLRGVIASDNADGDVTASVVVESVQIVSKDGTINVTYAAFDAAGNVAKAVRQVRYIDYKGPRFSLTRSLTFADNFGFDIFSLINAEDAFDGDITHRVRITSLDDASVPTIGNHWVEIKVSNSLGETSKLVIPVEIYAASMYDAVVTLTDYLVYLPVGGELDAQSYLEEYILAGSAAPLWEGLPEGYSLEIESDVQPDVPGVYTVAYRVTQTVGNGTNARTHTGYAKLIVVVEG